MTHRSTTSGKSIFSRAAAWLVAYAFVLQAVLAPIAAAAAPGPVPADTALVLCAEHAEALAQTPNPPIAPHDHEAICKFCIGCPANALLAPEMLVGAAVALAVAPIRWHAAFCAGPDRDLLSSKRARGPPALT